MGNFIDEIIATVAPGFALKRESSKRALEVLRAYDAGANGKRQSKVDRRNQSAPAVSQMSLEKLRGFSRELERNAGYVKKALNVLADNTVGADGIRPAFAGGSELARRRAEELWTAWAETTECDFDGLNTMYGLQHLIITAVHRDGEVLVIRRPDRKPMEGVLPFKLQVLEADFLDATKTLALDNSHYITQGVEYDSDGRRVAYWLFKSHPGGDTMFQIPESYRVPAEDVCHIYIQERAGQVRGIPTGVQAFFKILDLKDFEDSELIGKKVQACFAAFITTSNDNGMSHDQKRENSRIEPGIMQYLPPGDTIEFSSPPHSAGEESYKNGILRQVAAAYNITFESLSNNLSSVNYSSMRGGVIEMIKGILRVQRRTMVPMFCVPVAKWMSEYSMLTNKAFSGLTVTWTPPRRDLLDPLKEMEAMGKAMGLRLNSWEETVRECGWNPEELEVELIKDKERWKRIGIVPSYEADIEKSLAKNQKPAAEK